MPQHRAWPRLGPQESVLDGCMYSQAGFWVPSEMPDSRCSLNLGHSQQMSTVAKV